MAALALTSALIAVSCSGGSSDDTKRSRSTTSAPRAGTITATAALARVRHSIGVTRAARTARIANRLILDVSGQETNTASEGVADFVHERAEWTDDFSDVPGDRVPAGTPGRDLLLTVREVGRDLFVSLPVALPATQIHTTWVQARTTPLPGTNALTGFGGINPRVPIIARLERPDVALNLLRTARSARLVGPASSRGVATTQYATTVKLRELLDDVGMTFLFGTPRSRRDVDALDRLLARAVRVDVFLDASGRLRSVLADADLALLAPHFRPPRDPKTWRELRMQWDFYGFGTAAHVVRPTSSVTVVN